MFLHPRLDRAVLLFLYLCDEPGYYSRNLDTRVLASIPQFPKRSRAHSLRNSDEMCGPVRYGHEREDPVTCYRSISPSKVSLRLDGAYQFELPWAADDSHGGRDTRGGASAPRKSWMSDNGGESVACESERVLEVGYLWPGLVGTRGTSSPVPPSGEPWGDRKRSPPGERVTTRGSERESGGPANSLSPGGVWLKLDT